MTEIIMTVKKQLLELANKEYEDITIPRSRLVEFIETHSCDFPILVGSKKMWIHINDCCTDGRIMVERDISDGSEVFLD
jgi:hypothetical protein